MRVGDGKTTAFYVWRVGIQLWLRWMGLGKRRFEKGDVLEYEGQTFPPLEHPVSIYKLGFLCIWRNE